LAKKCHISHKNLSKYGSKYAFLLQFWDFELKDLTLRTNAKYWIIEHLNVLKNLRLDVLMNFVLIKKRV